MITLASEEEAEATIVFVPPISEPIDDDAMSVWALTLVVTAEVCVLVFEFTLAVPFEIATAREVEALSVPDASEEDAASIAVSV